MAIFELSSISKKLKRFRTFKWYFRKQLTIEVMWARYEEIQNFTTVISFSVFYGNRLLNLKQVRSETERSFRCGTSICKKKGHIPCKFQRRNLTKAQRLRRNDVIYPVSKSTELRKLFSLKMKEEVINQN